MTFRFAKLHIICVRDIVLIDPFRGQIRREDVRAFEKDRVELYKSFRPGDVVIARVLSLGEASSGEYQDENLVYSIIFPKRGMSKNTEHMPTAILC